MSGFKNVAYKNHPLLNSIEPKETYSHHLEDWVSLELEPQKTGSWGQNFNELDWGVWGVGGMCLGVLGALLSLGTVWIAGVLMLAMLTGMVSIQKPAFRSVFMGLTWAGVLMGVGDALKKQIEVEEYVEGVDLFLEPVVDYDEQFRSLMSQHPEQEWHALEGRVQVEGCSILKEKHDYFRALTNPDYPHAIWAAYLGLSNAVRYQFNCGIPLEVMEQERQETKNIMKKLVDQKLNMPLLSEAAIVEASGMVGFWSWNSHVDGVLVCQSLMKNSGNYGEAVGWCQTQDGLVNEFSSIEDAVKKVKMLAMEQGVNWEFKQIVRDSASGLK